MKNLMSLGLALACLASCTSRDTEYKSSSTNRDVGTTSASAPMDVPDMQTQDEADAHAAKSIHKDNADAEFEKLKKELSGG